MEKSPALNRILIATTLGSSLVFLDASVANIILPRLQESFHRGLLELQWVVTAYGVTLSAFLLLGGALGDRYGRRRIFLIGLALFSLASVACALSPSFWGLIVARSAQGVGGALLTPESLAILNAAFPKEKRTKAIGAWSAASALTAVIGPPLGGWITEMGSWRAVFLINVPMAIGAGYFGFTSIPQNCSETGSAEFDIRGSLLAVLGLAVLIFGMTNGSAWALVGVGVLGLFCLRESRAENPVLPLSVFKIRMFSRINLMTFFLYAAFAMTFFYLPAHLIRVEQYSTAQAGLALAPSGLVIAALQRPVGVWMTSRGTRLFLVGGAALMAAGCVILSFASPAKGYLVSYLPGFLLMGIGYGLTVTPLTARAMSALSDEESGLASGVNNAVARVAGVMGVTLAAALLTWSFRSFMGQEWKKDPLMPVPAYASQELKQSVDSARWTSFRELLWVSAAMCGLSGLVVARREDQRIESTRGVLDPDRKARQVVSGYCFHEPRRLFGIKRRSSR